MFFCCINDIRHCVRGISRTFHLKRHHNVEFGTWKTRGYDEKRFEFENRFRGEGKKKRTQGARGTRDRPRHENPRRRAWNRRNPWKRRGRETHFLFFFAFTTAHLKMRNRQNGRQGHHHHYYHDQQGPPNTAGDEFKKRGVCARPAHGAILNTGLSRIIIFLLFRKTADDECSRWTSCVWKFRGRNKKKKKSPHRAEGVHTRLPPRNRYVKKFEKRRRHCGGYDAREEKKRTEKTPKI